MEEWKDIVGYEGKYDVSDHGNLRHLLYSNQYGTVKRKKPRLLKPMADRTGHKFVYLYKDKKRKYKYVHCLELEAFEGPCPDGMEGCHNDGDPANNMRWNLRWDTHKNNQRDRKKHGTASIGSRHGCAKLTESDIPVIRNMYQNGCSQRKIAEDYGVAQNTISYICTRQHWRHVA